MLVWCLTFTDGVSFSALAVFGKNKNSIRTQTADAVSDDTSQTPCSTEQLKSQIHSTQGWSKPTLQHCVGLGRLWKPSSAAVEVSPHQLMAQLILFSALIGTA